MRTARVFGAALVLASITSPVLAGLSGESRFVPVPDYGPPIRPVASRAVGTIVDSGLGVREVPHRPVVQLPVDRVRVVGSATHRGRLLLGTASWYCGFGSRCTRGYTRGLYGAIRRDLLAHRGDRARVCASGPCVVVMIIDCNCGVHANLIDLYVDAFARLAPLSRGRIAVTLEWL